MVITCPALVTETILIYYSFTQALVSPIPPIPLLIGVVITCPALVAETILTYYSFTQALVSPIPSLPLLISVVITCPALVTKTILTHYAITQALVSPIPPLSLVTVVAKMVSGQTVASGLLAPLRDLSLDNNDECKILPFICANVL